MCSENSVLNFGKLVDNNYNDNDNAKVLKIVKTLKNQNQLENLKQQTT